MWQKSAMNKITLILKVLFSLRGCALCTKFVQSCIVVPSTNSDEPCCAFLWVALHALP